MSTAIISDLHLGVGSDSAVATRPEALELLCEALARADRVVVLGDLLELRERRAEEVLASVGPTLGTLGKAIAGRPLVLVPGNHDYELVAPALERARLDGREDMPLEGTYAPADGDLAQRVVDLLGGPEVSISYPGIRLRDDVWATHGHYADLHLTVPRVESVFTHTVARMIGRNGPERMLDAYEASVAPVYAFSHGIAQSARIGASVRGGNTSRAVWQRATGGGVGGMALGKVVIPTAVGALNRLGLGPFRADISALELRRGGLRAMGRVISDLGVDADHVLFGHTHRAGPLPGEVEGWWQPGGVRLHNTGNWALESAFRASSGPSNPYWPGRVTWLDDEGPPRFENVLEGYEL